MGPKLRRTGTLHLDVLGSAEDIQAVSGMKLYMARFSTSKPARRARPWNKLIERWESIGPRI